MSQKLTLCNTDISLLTNFSKFDIGRIDKRKVYEIAKPENSLSAFTLIQIAKFAEWKNGYDILLSLFLQ